MTISTIHHDRLRDTTTALMIIPPPSGLPEKIGQAYSKAMEEVCHLLDGPEVHQRFAYLLLTELRTKTALQSCTPVSLIAAIVEMAEEHLDPSGINECFLVPYQGEVKMQRGYAGLAKLACSHPEVLDIFADEVCVNDDYEFYGVNMRPKHIYPGAFRPRGRYIGYYAVAQLTQGRWRAVQMSVDEMKAHATHYSQNATKKVWSEERGGGFRGMSLKTVLRKICNPKYIPMSARVYEKLRQQDIIEGVVVDSVRAENREPLSVCEPEKTLTAHIADLCGDEPRGSTSQGGSALDVAADAVLGAAQEDTQVLWQQLTGLQDRLGWTQAQKKAWENHQARRFRKTFTDLPPETLQGLLAELEAQGQENLGMAQKPTDVPPGAAQEPQTPQQPTMRTSPTSASVLGHPGVQKQASPDEPAWKQTLRAHRDQIGHMAVQGEGDEDVRERLARLAEQMDFALSPLGMTSDSEGLNLAAAVLEWIEASRPSSPGV